MYWNKNQKKTLSLTFQEVGTLSFEWKFQDKEKERGWMEIWKRKETNIIRKMRKLSKLPFNGWNFSSNIESYWYWKSFFLLTKILRRKKLSWNGTEKRREREKKNPENKEKKLSILIFIDIDPKTGKIFLFACYFLTERVKNPKS